MKNTIEPAAEFIHRAAFVDANALPKDECGVEYKEPSQVQYYAWFKDHDEPKAVNEALKHVADMPGCMTYVEHQDLTIVGEEDSVWQTTLKTYTNERVSNTGRFHTKEGSCDFCEELQVVGARDLH